MYLTERDVWVLIFLFGLCGLLLIDNFFEVNRLENSLKTCRQDLAKLNAYNEYLYQEHLKTLMIVLPNVFEGDQISSGQTFLNSNR